MTIKQSMKGGGQRYSVCDVIRTVLWPSGSSNVGRFDETLDAVGRQSRHSALIPINHQDVLSKSGAPLEPCDNLPHTRITRACHMMLPAGFFPGIPRDVSRPEQDNGFGFIGS